MYKCQIEGCSWTGMIRSTIRNPQSEHNGKKCCPYHATMYNKPKIYISKQKGQDLEGYFQYHLAKLRNKPFSEESGRRIEPSKFSICHIFPKRIYKSVANHRENYVYLTWQEHADFDRLLDQMDFPSLEERFPKTWPKIKQRAGKILPEIKEYGKLLEKFKNYLDEKK